MICQECKVVRARFEQAQAELCSHLIAIEKITIERDIAQAEGKALRARLIDFEASYNELRMMLNLAQEESDSKEEALNIYRRKATVEETLAAIAWFHDVRRHDD
jgi:multidrug resistance efflux pump